MISNVSRISVEWMQTKIVEFLENDIENTDTIIHEIYYRNA